MPQLRIRDVKEEMDALTVKCSETNSQLTQKLDQVKTAVYVLAVVQLGLVAHLLFSILSR